MLFLVFLGVFLFTLIFIAILGNILVCVAIYTHRGPEHIGNLFLASLAIADLFIAAINMPLAALNDFWNYWLLGVQFCDTWIAFEVMCCTASILSLCLISLDRYISIEYSLRYDSVTQRMAVGAIACVWLLSGLMSFVPIPLGLHRPSKSNVFVSEDTKKPLCDPGINPTYAIVSSCITFYFPCLVMLVMYYWQYSVAKKHAKSIRAQVELNSTYQNNDENRRQPTCQQVPINVRDKKAAITLGIAMGTFLICWMPFFCLTDISAFCEPCIRRDILKVLNWLGYSNSAFNPIIYAAYNGKFRDAFRGSILTVRRFSLHSSSSVTLSEKNSSVKARKEDQKELDCMRPPRGSTNPDQGQVPEMVVCDVDTCPM